MTKKGKRAVLVVIIAVVVVFLFFILGPFYTLNETDLAVVTQFGKVQRIVTSAGLHWKVPLFDSVNRLEKRILEWDGEVKQFPTYDKRMILVDTTVRWRITDPQLFYESLSSVNGAMLRLDDILDAASREIVSQHDFESLIRNTNRITELDERTVDLLLEQGFTMEDLENFPIINEGRSRMAQLMKEKVTKDLNDMGIEVVNFYIKRINYIDDNLRSVFDSMVAERNKIAQTYRSQGENYREKKMGEIEQRTKEILASAQQEDKTIRGKADAEAAEIYNRAYNRNASTRDFYEFIKKMEMYKKLPDNATLIISTESEFFDMFKNY
jgi:membrane protease subunit HflC